MEKPQIKLKKQNNILIITLISLILIMYSSAVFYFKNHFYFGTTINGINASGKTVEEVNNKINSEVKSYKLVLKGRNGSNEKITASDINIKSNLYNKLVQYKKDQNPYNVINGIFSSKKYDTTQFVSYDEGLLTKRINNSSLLDDSKITKPENASLKFTGSEYEIVNEVNGNKIKKDVLYKKVQDAVLNNKKTISLEDSGCYENPKITSKSKEIIDAKDTLNKYLSSSITYEIGDNREVVDKAKINSFLKIDDNFNVEINKQKVRNYIDNLGYKYNTAGKTRDFVNSSGQSIKVNGGSYGWYINSSKETDNLVQAIKDGKTISKQPEYSRTARFHGADDIGKTYIEVDLTKQHLWFYKDGNLVVDNDVVTGCVSANHSTPEGVYSIVLKKRDAILKGQDYASPVSYWMPFNQDIGIHDANWRTEFGKDIYLTQGSHGCVNSPFDLAQTIFDNVDVGTPVVCHY